MEAAPLFDEIAKGPEGGRAVWVRAADDVRLRIGHWPAGRAARGTVLLWPGRTEYVEKYGPAARALAARGYGTAVIDWRGQGLSDRIAADAMSGHVDAFADYQRDVAAMIEAARAMDLPRPWHLLAHSMGGCIGLRAVIEGLPVASAIFSAPMWGIRISPALRPVAWSLSWGSSRVGMGHLFAPGNARESYVLREPYETNRLTRDRAMYQFMIDQVEAHPELTIGGPSLRWLHEALRECLLLSRLPSPDLPALTILGTHEEIVEPARITQRMADWPDGTLHMVEGARHEVLFEAPEVTEPIFDLIAAQCDRAGQRAEDTAPAL